MLCVCAIPCCVCLKRLSKNMSLSHPEMGGNYIRIYYVVNQKQSHAGWIKVNDTLLWVKWVIDQRRKAAGVRNTLIHWNSKVHKSLWDFSDVPMFQKPVLVWNVIIYSTVCLIPNFLLVSSLICIRACYLNSCFGGTVNIIHHCARVPSKLYRTMLWITVSHSSPVIQAIYKTAFLSFQCSSEIHVREILPILPGLQQI